MFDAISHGELSPSQSKAWLETVVREELGRIERLRKVSRLDPVGAAEDDRRHDWAAAQAWRHLAERGLYPSLDERDKSEILQSGTSEHYLETLEATLDIYARSVVSEAYVNRMVRDARQSIDDTSGEVVLNPPSAMSIIQLRQLLLAGKSAAWEAAAELKDPSIDKARDIAFALVQNATAALEDTRLPSCKDSSMAALSAPELSSQSRANALEPQSEDQDNKFTYDPNLLKLVERINAEKDRDHIKEDTRKQLVSQARLFIAATGIERVTEINQGHLKYYKSVLQKLPKSYGKSSKDSERTVDELLARASGLPKDKVGLSPRTINGHLDRFSLMFRVARSESLKISEDIQLPLLRVPETKRSRDKRDAFSCEQLIGLFRHPIWTGCRNHKRRHNPGNTVVKDGLYWGPLLAAYSGARREEVLALVPEDFVTVDEIPCYHIRDNEHRSVKTFSSERMVPIHSSLIELGFLGHVEEMRKRGEVAIFPELIPENQTESFGDKIYYNWNKALNQTFDGNPRDLCFHSFRHYAISRLKQEITVTDKERRDLVGHVGKDAHDEDYEEPTPMLAMKRVIELLPRVF